MAKTLEKMRVYFRPQPIKHICCFSIEFGPFNSYRNNKNNDNCKCDSTSNSNNNKKNITQIGFGVQMLSKQQFYICCSTE